MNILIAIARYHQNVNNSGVGRERHITAERDTWQLVEIMIQTNENRDETENGNGKPERTKTGKMRSEFKAFGQISINPEDFSLGMTARQEDLLHQMMTEQEESNPEQVKKAEKVLSWITKNYNVADVEKKDGTHHGELKTGKSNVKETLFVHKNKFQAAASKLNTVQNLANMKVTKTQ